MLNFSGVYYRIWAVCGLIFLLGLILHIFEKPWKKGFQLKKCKIALISIAFSIIMSLIYIARVICPTVSVYTGTYITSHRNTRVAPPLPFTYEYIFENCEEDANKVLYLDSFSMKSLCKDGFHENRLYSISYDSLTKIILKIDVVDNK